MFRLVCLVLVAAAPDLNEGTFAKWRDYIRPSERELRWLKIPWRAAVWPAVLEAQQTDKPLLIWAMNGHPLACT